MVHLNFGRLKYKHYVERDISDHNKINEFKIKLIVKTSEYIEHVLIS